MLFESPSAFSIYLKRLINPARKADDGWKTVKYNGRFLEQFKLELARRRFSGTRTPEDDSAGTSWAPCWLFPGHDDLASGYFGHAAPMSGTSCMNDEGCACSPLLGRLCGQGGCTCGVFLHTGNRARVSSVSPQPCSLG